MRISLVCPTSYYGASATRGIYYPMGILLLGSVLKDYHPGWQVDVIDGELYSKEDIERQISGSDVVGLSANTNNYPICLDLARFAKETGTKMVVIGGPHASAVLRSGQKSIRMSEIILQNRKEIDYVIVNDGEHALLSLLSQSQKNIGGIDNLFYREDGNIRHGQIAPSINLPRFADFDFSLMDLTRYWAEHAKEFPGMSDRFVEGFTHIGCAWKQKKGCIFCDIPYPTHRYQAPGRFWRDLEYIRSRHQIRAVKDYGDSITGSFDRLRELLASRPSDMADIEFSCYVRSSEVTDQTATLLKQLNVRYVYIGFDSGDNEMLQSMQKGYCVKANYNSVQRISAHGINITGSLIIGAAGESEATIANTERFAREVLSSSFLTQLHCAVINPFPGAPMAQRFIEQNPQYFDDDVWDVEETKRIWIRDQCKTSYEFIEEKVREINDLNPSSRKRYLGLRRE